jgi:hypothetical protein
VLRLLRVRLLLRVLLRVPHHGEYFKCEHPAKNRKQK